MSAPRVDVTPALRKRWWLVAGTPAATAALALGFVFWVTPKFEASATLQLVENESVLAGALATAAQGTGSGLSMLASLTGQGIPLQTEIAVLSSRGLLEELVEELGLRVEVKAPSRVLRSRVLSEIVLPLDGPEGTVELERQGDGTFRVSTRLLTERDPFRVIGKESYETRELGMVPSGGTVALDGGLLVLAPEAGEFERIVLRLLPRDEALEALDRSLSVTRPQREADVVLVTLAWSDPVVAAEGVNALVDSYLAYRESVRIGQARRSADFLALQLDSLAAELASAEEALRRFQETSDMVAPEAQITAEVERFADLTGRRVLLHAERTSLSGLIGTLDASDATAADQRRLAFFPTLAQSQGTAELLRLLGDLENERTLLLERRTEGAGGIRLMDQRIASLEGELRQAAETYLQGLNLQVAALDEALSAFQTELNRVPATGLEYARLQRQVVLLTELSLFLETRLKEAELNAAEEEVGAHVLGRARPPLEPESPKPALTLALALLTGLILGGAGAIGLEHAGSTSTAD